MTIFNSLCRKSLDELINEITADYWGHLVTEIVRVDEVLNKVDKVNANCDLKDRVYVAFEVDRVHRGDPVGWSLKEINAWPQKMHEYKVCNPSRYALMVPDPKSCMSAGYISDKGITTDMSEPVTKASSGGFSVSEIVDEFGKGLDDREKFYYGNAVQGILMYPFRFCVEDLKKAIWCVQDLISYLEREENNNETTTDN